jgi:hypothetical protein
VTRVVADVRLTVSECERARGPRNLRRTLRERRGQQAKSQSRRAADAMKTGF